MSSTGQPRVPWVAVVALLCCAVGGCRKQSATPALATPIPAAETPRPTFDPAATCNAVCDRLDRCATELGDRTELARGLPFRCDRCESLPESLPPTLARCPALDRCSSFYTCAAGASPEGVLARAEETMPRGQPDPEIDPTPPPGVGTTCDDLCLRAITCAAEGEPPNRAELAEVRARHGEVWSECALQCESEQTRAGEARILACLAVEECDAFDTCRAEL